MLACHVFRAEAARRKLPAAYRSVGLMHAYVTVALLLLADSAGLRVYDSSPLLAPQVRTPRWNLIEGYLGAWLTLRGVATPEQRATVDHREASYRALVLGAHAALDILGLRDSGLRRNHLSTMAQLFPARYLGLLAPAVAALPLSHAPGLVAPMLRGATRIPGVPRLLGHFDVDVEESRRPGVLEQAMENSRRRRRENNAGEY